MHFWSLVVACSSSHTTCKWCMINPNTLETVCSPIVYLHNFHSSATIVFGAVSRLRWGIKATLKFTVSTLNLHKILQVLFLFFNELKLQRICYRVIWNMSTKKTGDMMNKSINLNPVGNFESFWSSINSIFSFEIVEGSDKLFTFVKSWLVFTLAFSTTTDFEIIFSHIGISSIFGIPSFAHFTSTGSRITLSSNSSWFIYFQ